MKIYSTNEWDPLREIVVGTSLGANWPDDDPVFNLEAQRTLWKETPMPRGPLEPWIIEETEQDLNALVKILKQFGITVHRPKPNDFVASHGVYNYCPRDRLLIADDVIVDTAMMYPCRDQEIEYLDFLTEGNEVIKMPRDQGLVLDAANIAKLNDDWLFLRSSSGNQAAYDWLVQTFPKKRIHLCDFYAGVHIDSTVVPIREGVVMLNASRVNENNIPDVLKTWHKIWVDDVVPQGFYKYPYASKWIGMNTLSINPHTVVVDAAQTKIITELERLNFTVIPLTLRHSRTLGGGFHCVTLDTWRQHA